MNALRVRARSSPEARCSVCHDALGRAPTVCPGCRTLSHRDCRAELARCPSLGCAALTARARPRGQRLASWVFRIGAALFVGSLSFVPLFALALVAVSCRHVPDGRNRDLSQDDVDRVAWLPDNDETPTGK